MENLLSTTDLIRKGRLFIANNDISEGDLLQQFFNYAELMKQKPELSMFVGEKKLFENFEYPENAFLTNGNLTIDLETLENMVVEDLVKYNLKLTASAKKLLGYE